MSQIEAAAMGKLLAPLREKHQQELGDFEKKTRLARAKRQAATQFDMQTALAAGDTEGAMKQQQALLRADAMDRGSATALRQEHDIAARQAADRERQSWERITAQGGPGGYGGTGVKTAADSTVLPHGLAKYGPSTDQVDANAAQRMRGSGRAYLEPADFGNFGGYGVRQKVAASQNAFDAGQRQTAKRSALVRKASDDAAFIESGRRRREGADVKEQRARINNFDALGHRKPFDNMAGPTPQEIAAQQLYQREGYAGPLPIKAGPPPMTPKKPVLTH